MDEKKSTQRSLSYFMDRGDEYKTVDLITEKSLGVVHSVLKGLLGETPKSFKIRFIILHGMCIKAPRPKLKLEEISRLVDLDIKDLSYHLQYLKEGGILENKGTQYWKVTTKGRRILDNITILLFENNGDFDEIDIMRASWTHLSELAKEYKLDLKILSRIIRFFDAILEEIEEQSISMLDPHSAKKIRSMLRKADKFYEFLRSHIYKNDKIPPNDLWIVLDRLAERHQVIGKSLSQLNELIGRLSKNVDIQEAFGYYLTNLTPEVMKDNYDLIMQINEVNLFANIETHNLIEQANHNLIKPTPKPIPDFTTFNVKIPEQGEIIRENQNDLNLLIEIIKEKLVQGKLLLSDLIDRNNWEETARLLIQISELSAEGKIRLTNEYSLKVNSKAIKMIEDAEVELIG